MQLRPTHANCGIPCRRSWVSKKTLWSQRISPRWMKRREGCGTTSMYWTLVARYFAAWITQVLVHRVFVLCKLAAPKTLHSSWHTMCHKLAATTLIRVETGITGIERWAGVNCMVHHIVHPLLGGCYWRYIRHLVWWSPYISRPCFHSFCLVRISNSNRVACWEFRSVSGRLTHARPGRRMTSVHTSFHVHIAVSFVLVIIWPLIALLAAHLLLINITINAIPVDMLRYFCLGHSFVG